jgi:hypothetical protein
VLTSIAAVGLLGLGLLGGILIGQNTAPTGADASGPMITQQGNPGQFEGIPDGMKDRMKDRMSDRMKDRMKDNWQERRDQQSFPGAPQQDNN